MSMVIANNISAINTKRQFSTSSTGMAGAMERLSSGFKINTGKDDPSGLLISEKLRSQINGLQRAQQNTDEAMNVLGIAEGALAEMNSILKKMKALAIHAASNGVTSPDQVAADQAEMDSAIQTLDRIAQTTKFSDQTLLNGSKDIVYNQDTMIKSTQQNSLINTRESGFYQIFKRDDYAVSINFTGTKAADITTGHGAVDFTQQAMRAYLEVDTGATAVNGQANQTQVKDGAFTQAQQFTLTGAQGSRSFSFKQGETVATMVSQIKSAADTTGINAALVFNSDQKIDKLDGDGGPVDKLSVVIKGAKTADGKSVSITLDSDEQEELLADISKALNGRDMSFSIGDDGSGNLTLDLIVDGKVVDNIITAGDTWDGSQAAFNTALASHTWSTGDSDLDDALNDFKLGGGTITLSGNISLGASNLDGFAMEGTLDPTNSAVVVTGIYGTVNGDDDLTVDFRNVDLQAIFDSLDAEDQSLFADAIIQGTLAFEVSVTGTEGDFDVTISLVDGSGNEFHSLVLNSITDLTVNSTNGAITPHTEAGGLFDGLTLSLTQGTSDWTGTPANALPGVSGSQGIVGVSAATQISFDDFLANPSLVTLGSASNLHTGFYSTGGGSESISVEFDLEELLASLSPANQRSLYDAIVAGTLEIVTSIGGTSTDGDFDLIIALRDGTNTIDTVTLNSLAMGVDTTDGTLAGYTTTSADGMAGLTITIDDNGGTTGYVGGGATLTAASLGPTTSPIAGTIPTVMPMSTGAISFIGAAAETGGLDFVGTTAARENNTLAIFNNDLSTDGLGTVVKGVKSVELTDDASDTIEYGFNTDGQGRIYVKFLDDHSYELYKDASMSAESLVATGTDGKEIREANNSGLKGFILELAGGDLVNKRGVYISLAGIEGQSENLTDGKPNGTYGVTYNNSMFADGAAASWSFDKDRTLFTGVELGVNTSDTGEIYFKNVITHDKTGEVTIQVFAYKHKDMKDADLVASSEKYLVRDEDGLDAQSMTILLNEVRSADNTTGTGLGIVLSVGQAAFEGIDKSMTLTGTASFNNLGARVYAEDYGSKGFIKVTQDKGALFSYYGSGGDMNSVKLIDAGLNGTVFQQTGQDATLSVNGREVKTDGLTLNMATQDIQAYFLFNQGKVGSTTLAQVGYELGSIFTKIGALNLGEKYSTDEAGDERDDKYQFLSGLLCNAGHVTNENLNNFQGGMQLQLGEGAGDQNRTVVALKGMTSEDLGRVTKGGYWETGSSVWSEKSFTLKDVMGGGTASLSANATLAMEIIEQAVNDVSYMRATIGAMQTNLLQTNSNNLSVTIENLTKTESAIRDADMADEMTDFTKFQVLQNAAMTMMSQANQSSQNILQLLR